MEKVLLIHPLHITCFLENFFFIFLIHSFHITRFLEKRKYIFSHLSLLLNQPSQSHPQPGADRSELMDAVVRRARTESGARGLRRTTWPAGTYVSLAQRSAAQRRGSTCCPGKGKSKKRRGGGGLSGHCRPTVLANPSRVVVVDDDRAQHLDNLFLFTEWHLPVPSHPQAPGKR